MCSQFGDVAVGQTRRLLGRNIGTATWFVFVNNVADALFVTWLMNAVILWQQVAQAETSPLASRRGGSSSFTAPRTQQKPY